MPKRKRKMYYHDGGNTMAPKDKQEHIAMHGKTSTPGNLSFEVVNQLGRGNHFLTENVAGLPHSDAMMTGFEAIFGVQDAIDARALLAEQKASLEAMASPAEQLNVFGATELGSALPPPPPPSPSPTIDNIINTNKILTTNQAANEAVNNLGSLDPEETPSESSVFNFEFVPEGTFDPSAGELGAVDTSTRNIMAEAYINEIFDFETTIPINDTIRQQFRQRVQVSAIGEDEKGNKILQIQLFQPATSDAFDNLKGDTALSSSELEILLSKGLAYYANQNNPKNVKLFESEVKEYKEPEKNLLDVIADKRAKDPDNELYQKQWDELVKQLEIDFGEKVINSDLTIMQVDSDGVATISTKMKDGSQIKKVGSTLLPSGSPTWIEDTSTNPQSDVTASTSATAADPKSASYFNQDTKEYENWVATAEVPNPPNNLIPAAMAISANLPGAVMAAEKTPSIVTFYHEGLDKFETIDINNAEALKRLQNAGYITTSAAELAGQLGPPTKTTTLPDGQEVELTDAQIANMFGITAAQQATIDHNDALLEETAKQNNLTNAYRNTKMAADNAFRQAELAESQGQFDRSLALQAFGQQTQAEATRINAQLQMSQQNIERLNQITGALSRPSDAVAASFALTGQQSPMGVFTQADAINPYIADMMDQRSSIEAFGPGFRAEDFLEGYGRRANPAAQNPDPKGVMSIGATDKYGNQIWTLFDGTQIVRTAPTAENPRGGPPQEVPESNTGNTTPTGEITGEHGGYFSNPIIVGDSKDDKENQELVMSFGNAPMVVLPLDEKQQKIMADANEKIPKYHAGGHTLNEQESAFTPANTRDAAGNPGLAGFESMYPFTQEMIQQRSDLLTSPRVRRVLQGTAGEGTFRQMPTQMPFALPTPGFMRNLTGTEREFLRSNLATRNIFLDDVETAVGQRFGRTNTTTGRRRFN
jgi:DNA-binding PadR family transcriptional regulator